MQHYSPFKTLLIILTACFFLSSCSTGYQASRFSHLKYVKKDHASTKDDSQAFNKENIQNLTGNHPAPIEAPGNDYTTSLEKIPAQKPIHKSSISKPGYKLLPTPGESLTIQDYYLRSGIGQTTASVKNKFNDLNMLPSASLLDDQNKLLVLWLILAGAAVVFGLLYSVSTAFGILATIAAVAAVIFFILWIVNIAKS